MKVIVIGGVAAGMSAASKLKRSMEDVTVSVYEKSSDVSYGACGMPYYLSDVIKKDDALVARTPEQFKERGIDVFTKHEVTDVDFKNKTVTVKNLTTKEHFNASYDKLLITTGASAIRLPVEGSDLPGIHVLSSLDDARALKDALTQKTIKTVSVIGAGYIGVEVAENLVEMGKNVQLIEMQDQVLPPYDSDMSAHVEKRLKGNGVDLHLNTTLKHYEGTHGVSKIVTDHGSFETDLVIEAIGVRPNTAFLKDSDLTMLKNGAIHVNNKQETSIPDVYSAGDCASVPHLLKDAPAYVPLGTHANKAGRVIAAQLSGEDAHFHGVVGSNVLKAFDLEVAKTGLSEKEAAHENYDYDVVNVKAANQAGYYPGATPIYMKIVFENKTCKLLGAQMVGKQGVSARINIMATAIQRGMTASEFSNLDLAYAPPFSPVWDPLQVATNQIKC